MNLPSGPKRLGLRHHRRKLPRHSLPMRPCLPGTTIPRPRRSHLPLGLPRLMRRGSYTSFSFPSASPISCRAHELQGDGMIGRYRPPALRALASGGSPLNEVSPGTTIAPTDSSCPPTNTDTPGYRRARVGTLLSNVSLAAQQYVASNTPSPRTLPSTESFNEHIPPQASATPPILMWPTLGHSTSVAPPAVFTPRRHQGITTSSMDAFTGQSNWNWEEAAPPPGQPPFRIVRMLVESFRTSLILYSYSCIGGVSQHFRLSNATSELCDPRRSSVHDHSPSVQSTVK